MEFVAVVPLLMIVGLAVLQLALFAHAQGVVSSAAVEAARAAAVSADPSTAARERAEEIVGDALGDVGIAGFRMSRGEVSGMPVVTVEIEARPDLAFIPDLAVARGTGRALLDGAP